MLVDINPEEDYEVFGEELHSYICTRDNDLCVMCGGGGQEVHHIIFRSQGGTNKPNNLSLLCKKCHHKQHSHNPISQDVLFKRIKKNEKVLREQLV